MIADPVQNRIENRMNREERPSGFHDRKAFFSSCSVYLPSATSSYPVCILFVFYV